MNRYGSSPYDSGSKAVVKNADMPEDLQRQAINIAAQAMDRYGVEKDIAAHLKKEFDQIVGPTWHCIVGRNFGSHKNGSMIPAQGPVGSKAVIKNADMADDMQQKAVDCAQNAMNKHNVEKDIAAYIKKEFDKLFHPTWHCIVGKNFGSYVTHETRHFMYFYMGQVAILLFKSG